MKPDKSAIRARMTERGVSIRFLAARVKVHPGHLHRVLAGERPGSRALLERAAAVLESISIPSPDIPRDSATLFDAAIHLFLVKRGEHQSAIFSTRPRT